MPVADIARLRREKIMSLAISLISDCTKNRIELAAAQSFTGIHASVMDSFRSLEFRLPVTVRRRSSSLNTTRKQCEHKDCKALPAQKRNKHSKVCQSCDKIFCDEHLYIMSTIICHNCDIDE